MQSLNFFILFYHTIIKGQQVIDEITCQPYALNGKREAYVSDGDFTV